MVTLSSPSVGEYVAENFVSTYQQKGDFTVTQVRGNVQKNGGNVVSYFCTPGMRVVHLVVGPVKPERFLAEARFARAAYDAALGREVSPVLQDTPVRGELPAEDATKGSSKSRSKTLAAKKATKKATSHELSLARKAVAAEHMRLAGGNPVHSLRELQARDPLQAKGEYARKYEKDFAERRWQKLIWGTSGNDSERVHRLLAYDPLPPLTDIDTAVFQSLAGQIVNDGDGSVAKAVAQVERATKAGRPVMFVFYNDWWSWRYSASRKTLQQGQLPKLIAQFEVVNLPVRELPALSSQLKGFELPEATERASVQIVLTDCQKRRLAVVSDHIEPAQFGATLQGAFEENRLAHAERLAAEKRPRDAKRLLAQSRRSKNPEIAEKAKQLLAGLE